MFAHCFDADDLDAHVQILDHPSDDRQLLEVLAAEDSEVRADSIEEFDDDGGNAAEVPRASGAFKWFGQRAGLDMGLEPDWVHRILGRCVDGRDTTLSASSEVVVEAAGVPLEVIRPIELQSIDENADHDDVGTP